MQVVEPPIEILICQTLTCLESDLKSQDTESVFRSVRTIRMLLCGIPPPIDHVLNCGGLPLLVECLKYNSTDVQADAISAIINITVGTSDHTFRVIQAGCLGIFPELLWSDDSRVRERTVWAYGNITCRPWEVCNLVMQTEVFPKMIEMAMNETHSGILREVVRNFSNIFYTQPVPGKKFTRVVLRVLAHMYRESIAMDVRIDALSLVAFMANDHELMWLVLENDLLSHLLPNLCLDDSGSLLVLSSLRIFGNLMAGDDDITKAVVNIGILRYMKCLMKHPNENVRLEVFWMMSNIIAGHNSFIQSVIDEGLIIATTSLFFQEKVPKVKAKMLCSLKNATLGTFVHIQYLIDNNVISVICEALTEDLELFGKECLCISQRILISGSEFVTENEENPYLSIMMKTGLIDIILGLQNHSNRLIGVMASTISRELFRNQ